VTPRTDSALVSFVIVETPDTRMIVDANTPRERAVAIYRLQLLVAGCASDLATTRTTDLAAAAERFAARLAVALERLAGES